MQRSTARSRETPPRPEVREHKQDRRPETAPDDKGGRLEFGVLSGAENDGLKARYIVARKRPFGKRGGRAKAL